MYYTSDTVGETDYEPGRKIQYRPCRCYSIAVFQISYLFFSVCSSNFHAFLFSLSSTFFHHFSLTSYIPIAGSAEIQVESISTVLCVYELVRARVHVSVSMSDLVLHTSPKTDVMYTQGENETAT